MSTIVNFLQGEGVDIAGRTHAQVLELENGELERRHDFIQWLFPLIEASAAVPGSPILTQADVVALRASINAQRTLAAASTRMRRFYEETSHWLTSSNHNHLRITRIIKSLHLLCGDTAADAFRDRIGVLASGAPISPTSRRYWSQA